MLANSQLTGFRTLLCFTSSIKAFIIGAVSHQLTASQQAGDLGEVFLPPHSSLDEMMMSCENKTCAVRGTQSPESGLPTDCHKLAHVRDNFTVPMTSRLRHRPFCDMLINITEPLGSLTGPLSCHLYRLQVAHTLFVDCPTDQQESAMQPQG